MKGAIYVFVISVFFSTSREQCPENIGNTAVTSCDGSRKYGSYINIDFYEINRTCTCIVTPLFAGDLLVISTKIIQFCDTQVNVQSKLIFGCPANFTSQTLKVVNHQKVNVKSEYKPASLLHVTTFYHCLGLKQNGGGGGNLSVICGLPQEASTVSPTTVLKTTSTQLSLASTHIASSVETASVVNTIENTDVTISSNTINVSHDSLSIESTKDDPEMLYIVLGSAAGGVIILGGLIVLILLLINRTRSSRNKREPTETDRGRTNEVFDSNPELPDNPLYLTSQPVDELGYSSDQEKQLGLPPTDSKTKKKINPDYDVPPNNKPIAYGTSSMPVYAVPKRGKDRIPEVTSGDVYAEVCKPNRSTGKDPVRKRNEDGLLYMEAEQDTAGTKQTNTKNKQEIPEGVCYAEIKHT